MSARSSSKRRSAAAFGSSSSSALAVLGYANREQVQQLPIGCGAKAKILCDGLFLSGRDEAVLLAEDLGFHPLFKLLKPRVDRDKKTVSVSFLGTGLFKKTAVFLGPLGSVILNGVSEAEVRSWKADIPAPEPADPEAIAWPTGDLDAAAPIPETFDRVRLEAAVDRVFAETNPDHALRTRALLVVHDGKLIVERYGSGIARDTRLISWSVAKTVTSALVGILVGEGKLALQRAGPGPGMARSRRPPPRHHPGASPAHEPGPRMVRGLRRASRVGRQ